MSLKPIESKSMEVYFRTEVFAPGNFTNAEGFQGPPPQTALVYYDRLDQMIMRGERNESPSPNVDVNVSWDPLGEDNTAPLARSADIVGGLRPSRMAVGEWDRLGNIQKIYAGQSPPEEIWPFDPVTLLMTDPGSSLYNFLWSNSNVGEGTIGGWTGGAGGDLALGGFHFFETWGYALRGCARCRHTDNNLYRGLILIDLNDAGGKATLLDTPTVFTSAPRALFEAQSFNGEDFTLGCTQFVPDDDDLPGAPKGRVFLGQGEYLGDGDVPNSDDHKYVKVIDWNPLGVAPAEGTPNRVHLRTILMTRLNFIQRQAFGTNPISLGDFPDGGATYVNSNLRSYYHNPTRTVITFNDTISVGNENERGIVRHSITPELNQLESPTAQSEVETNKTVVFKARGMGDLGDPLAGVTATWSLARRSTIEEVLDTSEALPTNVVAHPPIDDDTLVVEYNGTPLIEDTDYSVVESTGTITWMGGHSPPAASGYTATYRHSTASTTPPHGTLLQETSETGVDGVAETRIQYADDDELVGDRDRVTCSMSDD